MKSFDPGTFFTLLPGVKAEDGVIERAEEKRETLRFNKAADHLRRRIRESGGRDRDAEILMAELKYGDASMWKAPERF
jgi:hypothetical protein